MSLSDREKFIVHLITVRVSAAMITAPEAAMITAPEAADKVLGTLKDARVRKLPEEEVEDIISSIEEEMKGATTFLTHRKKEWEDDRFRKETEKWR